MVNPNVGAVLVLDWAAKGSVTNRDAPLRLEYTAILQEDVPHAFMRLEVASDLT